MSLPVMLGGAALLVAIGFGAAHIAKIESDQQNIAKQLDEIKTMLRRPAAPQVAQQPARRAPDPIPADLTVSIKNAAVTGKADAPVTLVEFSDFECPFCGKYSRETFDQLKKDYVDTGKVKYVFRNFPLQSLHPHAFKAGVAAECVREQGKFWTYHERLFAHQDKLTDADLRATAGAIGANLSEFDRCVAGAGVARVQNDEQDGGKAGVTGTPFFFIGYQQKDGSIKVVNRFSGAAPYETFKTAIDGVLAAPKPVAN
ncbi:MAG TPA: DsbA family protein [Vicinamibacterales bacterium]|nr:DsbA family protein [Vicinamibacterales bacterium]